MMAYSLNYCLEIGVYYSFKFRCRLKNTVLPSSD